MNVSVIASGSNGNCCLLEDKDTSVLLDAGISIKEYEKRMQRLEKDPALTKAIVITHAHRDHIKGAGPISRKYNIPILITQQTYADSSTIIKKAEVRFFSTLSDFKIGNMNITPIRTSHDVFSCGFKINDFGLFTDTGIITSQIREVFPKLKSVLIEANYDHDMLKNGNYPQFLKKRIFSDVGHLDNKDTCDFLQKEGKHLDLLLLGHLSGNNNTPDVLRETFESIVSHKFDYEICSRDRESGSWKV